MHRSPDDWFLGTTLKPCPAPDRSSSCLHRLQISIFKDIYRFQLIRECCWWVHHRALLPILAALINSQTVRRDEWSYIIYMSQRSNRSLRHQAKLSSSRPSNPSPTWLIPGLLVLGVSAPSCRRARSPRPRGRWLLCYMKNASVLCLSLSTVALSSGPRSVWSGRYRRKLIERDRDFPVFRSAFLRGPRPRLPPEDRASCLLVYARPWLVYE